jgi:non-canonical (house-cleaning) NTP pyrophosphatase
MTIKNNINADFYVGIEGGISKLHDIWFSYGCVCVANNNNLFGYGTSPLSNCQTLLLKDCLKEKELGTVMDELFNHKNSKQS